MLGISVAQVFLPMGTFWLMPNTDTQCTVRGGGRPKSREQILCLNFSCFDTKYEFLLHKSFPPVTDRYKDQ